MKEIAQLSKEIADTLDVSKESVTDWIIDRIGWINDFAKFFILENEYTEREWKEMVSLHYINTSYAPPINVSRIHFFTDEKIETSSYLGFACVRPINETKYSLSFVYPNWRLLGNILTTERYQQENMYVMTYKRSVNVVGKMLTIDTFPFFAQDGIVTRCAHASLVMVTKFTKNMLGYRLVKISNIVKEHSFITKLISTEGVTVHQMVEVFNNAEIPVSAIRYSEYEEDFKEWLDSYIESKIPVIVTFDGHVVTIVGHTNPVHQDGEKRYIVYDDSGYFFTKIYDSKKFVDFVTWGIIKREMKKGDYMIAPEMERIYVPFPYIKGKFSKKLKPVLETSHQIISERYLIVDNSRLKRFLSKKATIEEADKSKFDEFIKSNLPHYLWFCETIVKKNGKEMLFGFCADPTKHWDTSTNIFYNLTFKLKEQISLLNLS